MLSTSAKGVVRCSLFVEAEARRPAHNRCPSTNNEQRTTPFRSPERPARPWHVSHCSPARPSAIFALDPNGTKQDTAHWPTNRTRTCSPATCASSRASARSAPRCWARLGIRTVEDAHLAPAARLRGPPPRLPHPQAAGGRERRRLRHHPAAPGGARSAADTAASWT